MTRRSDDDGRYSIDVVDEDITHHDEGVSFEVTMQHGSSSDRTRVKAKLKSETLADFADEKDDFLAEVRDGAQTAAEYQDDVFGDDE